MIKKLLCLLLAFALCLAAFTGCNVGISGTLKGAHVFMFKITGNAFGDLMYEGFSKAVIAAGGTPAYKSPAEGTVSAQVEMLDTLITQKVASITISTCGATGYEEVFKRARAAGISIVSVDSAASPDYRTTHVEQVDPVELGRSMVQAAILIVCRVDYPADGDLDGAVQKALQSYTGKAIKFGALSAAVDTPIQNLWINCMERELKKDLYAGKVDPKITVKYGNDEPTESRRQADAFIAENEVDMIISPTTIGMFAAGEALKSSGSSIQLTGLGLPSEMKDYMPLDPAENAFDRICPYMLLWNVKDLGEIVAAVTLAAASGQYDGQLGSSFTYNGKTYTTVPAEDGGTRIIGVDPFVFHKGNMAEWVDVL